MKKVIITAENDNEEEKIVTMFHTRDENGKFITLGSDAGEAAAWSRHLFGDDIEIEFNWEFV